MNHETRVREDEEHRLRGKDLDRETALFRVASLPDCPENAPHGELKGRLPTHNPKHVGAGTYDWSEYYSPCHVNLEESGYLKRSEPGKGRIAYALSFLCAGNHFPNRPVFVEPWWAIVKCPVCSVPFQEIGGEHFCSKCGVSLKYEIPDEFEELAAKARLNRKYRKANSMQIYMFSEPVFCSDHKERVMQKHASDFIDYRIVTLLKDVGGCIHQNDIPLEYKKTFTDNDNGAIITPAKVRASIERLRSKGKVKVSDISTSQGKRIIIELVDAETLRQKEIASRTIKITPAIAAQLNLTMPTDSECVNSSLYIEDKEIPHLTRMSIF